MPHHVQGQLDQSCMHRATHGWLGSQRLRTSHLLHCRSTTGFTQPCFRQTPTIRARRCLGISLRPSRALVAWPTSGSSLRVTVWEEPWPQFLPRYGLRCIARWRVRCLSLGRDDAKHPCHRLALAGSSTLTGTLYLCLQALTQGYAGSITSGRVAGIYTFGEPRVGNGEFVRLFNQVTTCSEDIAAVSDTCALMHVLTLPHHSCKVQTPQIVWLHLATGIYWQVLPLCACGGCRPKDTAVAGVCTPWAREVHLLLHPHHHQGSVRPN